MRPPGVIRWVAEKLLPRADLVKPRTASFRSPNEFVRPFPPKRLLNIGNWVNGRQILPFQNNAAPLPLYNAGDGGIDGLCKRANRGSGLQMSLFAHSLRSVS
jgi:hypothetical protein